MSGADREEMGPDVRLSGRALAARRREAMARFGKGAWMTTVGGAGEEGKVAAPPSSEGMGERGTARFPAGRWVAQQRRAAIAAMGKAAIAGANSAATPAGRGRRRGGATMMSTGEAATSAEGSSVSAAVGPAWTSEEPARTMGEGGDPLVAALAAQRRTTVRDLAIARRQAVAVLGKVGMRRAAYAARLATNAPSADWLSALQPSATGRQIAMQRRLLQSRLGKLEGEGGGSRPTGRVRPTAKVEIDQTLRGSTVTGSAPMPSPRVTGMEAGGCRTVTGTEYLGTSYFEEVCDGKTAAPGAAKVTVSHTARGRAVTGTRLSGEHPPVTGGEEGRCVPVTGTEYLPAEHFVSVCRRQPPESPAKVGSAATRGGERVTGTVIGRSERVTGDEAGACRPITGTPYYEPRDFGAACARPAPPKVEEQRTEQGSRVTGSVVVAAPKATGDDSEVCAPVTGTEYVDAESARQLCPTTPPPAPVPKVRVHKTWRGLPITGTSLQVSARVTGMEAGACAPVTGTPYLGPEYFAANCPAPLRAVQEEVQRRGAFRAPVTGDRPGVGGGRITGDERGACAPVTGSPYVGPDNAPVVCPPTRGKFAAVERPSLPPEPAQAEREESAEAEERREGGFSIMTPMRWAARQRVRVTGMPTGGGERVTGPVNKADGLVTGTPEFRAARAEEGAEEERAAARARLSGEAASRARVRITGDAWEGRREVTGTEGASARAWNTTWRGTPRGEPRNARTWLNLERPEVPPSPVTGSAGTTMRGALVTVSGGARG
ncbi:MAG: CsoS2 family carboxysome shell protein [Hydrogenophilus sp.]|nr:CsoS2 family carboxysome shell protein [Hydrogenophilus sp.]